MKFLPLLKCKVHVLLIHFIAWYGESLKVHQLRGASINQIQPAQRMAQVVKHPHNHRRIVSCFRAGQGVNILTLKTDLLRQSVLSGGRRLPKISWIYIENGDLFSSPGQFERIKSGIASDIHYLPSAQILRASTFVDFVILSHRTYRTYWCSL